MSTEGGTTPIHERDSGDSDPGDLYMDTIGEVGVRKGPFPRARAGPLPAQPDTETPRRPARFPGESLGEPGPQAIGEDRGKSEERRSVGFGRGQVLGERDGGDTGGA